MVTGDSIRKKVYNSWVENPYLTPKKTCAKLRLDYKVHGNYVKKLLSEFRCYHKFGSPQKALSAHRRVFVWECVDRPEPLDEMPLVVAKAGWRWVANRNEMWVFRHDLGSVHWYKGGLVRLYLRGNVHLARAKELFSRAFSWFTGKELSKYLDVPLREESKHWVFDVGAPMPRFDIRKFERSHGLRIFTDGSHPTALEVEETTPFWIGRLDQSMESFGNLHTKFNENLKEHMKLIRLWQKEARGMRGKVVRRIKKRKLPAQRSLLNWLR